MSFRLHAMSIQQTFYRVVIIVLAVISYSYAGYFREKSIEIWVIIELILLLPIILDYDF